jgi:pyrimidine deaminase RibD-like protein
MNKYLEKAIDVAARSRCRYRHGCIVVKNGKIIAESTNKKVGDPSVAWRMSHIHAEFAAIVAAGNRAVGSHVYVARVASDGSPAPSKPCKKCENILNRSGVAKVIWT